MFRNTLDLNSAYHQITIADNERPYTAFEACGNLFQFLRVPFEVTNRVSSFQQTIDTVIRNKLLQGNFS